VFGPAWRVLALSQPLSALSFATDGIHWGTSDFRYLRNAMLVATGVSAAVLGSAGSLEAVWWISLVWMTVRAGFGVVRVWPGVGRAPLAVES